MQDEQNIPIDIHLNKLLDWLISRRLCLRNWQQHILLVRQNINNAIQDMPAVDEVTRLLTGTYINYFHCCRIVEILKETEASSKNIFGRYSSQRMKDWQEIVKLYEENNTYLAEAAQLLVRNIMYEIPSMKKQLMKCKQAQEDFLKKESDYMKSSNAMKEKYRLSCEQIGIKGVNIKKELIALLDELPEALSVIAAISKNLCPIMSYYYAFLSFHLDREKHQYSLPMLDYITSKGNTTVYEWHKGEPPDVIEVTTPILPLDVDSSSTGAGDDQIDFGDLCTPSESGDDRSSSSPNGDFVHIDREECKFDNGDQIDFGDTDINWDSSVESPGITVLESPEETEGGKVARGSDALSILEHEATRNLFYNELLELEAFLEQCIIEKKLDDDFLSANLFQSAPQILQLQSIDSISLMLSTVKDISTQLMTTKLKHLYLIKESSQYVDRLVDTLRSKLDSADKMTQSQKAVKLKYYEAVEEHKALEPKITLIVEKTKLLISQIETDISKRYKNRPVNLMGGLSAF